MRELPLVDLAAGDDVVAGQIDAACREVGFFTVVGHGVDPALRDRMDAAVRDFFARPGRRRLPSPWSTVVGRGGAGSPSTAS